MGSLQPVTRDALIQQVNIERQNAAIYHALAARLDFLNLTGAAKYFRTQGNEENEHAAKFTDYLIDRNSEPRIGPLEGVMPPQFDMLTGIAVASQFALAREILNTEYIKTIHATAEQDDDPQTCVWLIWALEEQTHAERELTELVARATFAQGCPAAILALDKELGA